MQAVGNKLREERQRQAMLEEDEAWCDEQARLRREARRKKVRTPSHTCSDACWGHSVLSGRVLNKRLVSAFNALQFSIC